AAYYGPSYMINPLTNYYSGYKVESVLINCHYPVTADSFVLQWGVMVKKPTGVSAELADTLAEKFTGGISEGFLQAGEYWQHKPPKRRSSAANSSWTPPRRTNGGRRRSTRTSSGRGPRRRPPTPTARPPPSVRPTARSRSDPGGRGAGVGQGPHVHRPRTPR